MHGLTRDRRFESPLLQRRVARSPKRFARVLAPTWPTGTLMPPISFRAALAWKPWAITGSHYGNKNEALAHLADDPLRAATDRFGRKIAQVGIVQVGPIRSASGSALLAANYGVTSPSSIRFFFDSPCETMKCD